MKPDKYKTGIRINVYQSTFTFPVTVAKFGAQTGFPNLHLSLPHTHALGSCLL